MNGNDLANVLRWPKGKEYQYEWYAGQELPKEWWKTSFPYGKAERMGYRLSPEETREFYERRKKEKEKTLSEELVDILKRPEIKMLTAPERASLIKIVAEAQETVAEAKRKGELHETVMLEKGRVQRKEEAEISMRNKVQAILQSNRTPVDKYYALWKMGIPQSEASEMVWGEREPEAEAGRPTREAPPAARARPEELAEALRPEEERGVQFRMVGGELIKEAAGKWEGRYTPEERAAMRKESEAKYERRRTEQIEARKAEQDRIAAQAKETRENIKAILTKEAAEEKEKAKERQERIDSLRTLSKELKTKKIEEEEKRLKREQEIYEDRRKTIKEAMEKDEERVKAEAEAKKERTKEVRELGEAAADKRYNRKIEQIKYDDGRKKIEKEELDAIRDRGEKAAKTERDYKEKILDKTVGWMKTFHDMGFDNEELVEVIPEFLGTLDVNKEQEDKLMKALGVVGKIEKRKEEEVITDLETALKEQCQTIDGDVAREGITEEIENKIEWVAFLEFGLDEKVLGHDKAVEKWQNIVETGWWLGREKIPFKKVKVQEVFKEKMKGVIAKAKTTDIMDVAGKLLGEENQKYAQKIAGQFSKEKGREIGLPGALRTALVGFGDNDTSYIIESYKGLFNTKTGKMTKEPGITERQRALAFAVGIRDDERFKGEVPDESEKGKLPVNMTEAEFLKALIQEPKLSRIQKGWLIWKRFDPTLWIGVENEAGLLGHLIMSKSEEGKKDGILDKIGRAARGVFEKKPETHWLFKPAEKALVKIGKWWEGKEETKPTPEGREGRDIRGDLRQIVKDHPGIKGREAAIYLKEKGWSDEEIRALGGAR